MQVRSPTAMKRIAGSTQARSAIFPMTCPADVGTVLVSEKHLGTAIEALGVPLQASRRCCQQRQVCIIRNDDKHIDVLRIRLVRDEGPQDGHPPHAGHLPSRRHESSQAGQQLPTMTHRRGRHGDRSIKSRDLARRHQDLDRSRLAGCPPDQAPSFERKDHVVDGRRGDVEVPLTVRLRRRTSVQFRVGHDERQVLTLQLREPTLQICRPLVQPSNYSWTRPPSMFAANASRSDATLKTRTPRRGR
jgi:hypothetical protein